VLTIEQLVDDCQGLLSDADAEHAVAGYVSKLLRDRPGEVTALLGESSDSLVLHRADDLTVVSVVMPPRYTFYPHNHLMWGVVGTVVGREDNTFFARTDDAIVPTTGASYEQGQVGVLSDAVIHSVRNPSRAHTVGLHIYGGDLAAAPASEWDPESGEEHRYDAEASAARRAAWVASLPA
jgi:predicted metal-dependent enzyme (double-stranded beta helix superfamily)